jgi:hypothetical protein
VLDLRTEALQVVAILATREGCDAAGREAFRSSPFEAALIGSDQDLGATRSAVLSADPGALVEDVTEGWAAFVLEGPETLEALARLSELEPPDGGWITGEVARVGVRVHATPGRLTFLVPVMLAHHLEERIRTDCAELLS